MEFRLDPGQVELQQTVRRLFADRFPLDGVGGREGARVDRDAWANMARVGITGLLLPEDHGGAGLGVLEAALVFEQAGSHLVPGPLLWTVLAAPLLAASPLAAGVATGGLLVGGVEGADCRDGSAVVEHAADLDVLLVVHDDCVLAHPTDHLPGPTPLDPLDPLTPVGRFTVPGGGGPDGGGPDGGVSTVGDGGDAARLRVVGTTLAAASLVGVAGRALEVARDHALERHQFGVPIGSFQAVKHLLADMYVRNGVAQSATYAAAASLDDPATEPRAAARAAAGAKLLASEAAIEGAGTAVQVLGGMGFTWDMLPNHLLKRAWVLELCFGTADDLAGHVGSALAAGTP